MGHHDRPYYAPKETRLKTIMSWVYTVDHKKIGVMYLCAVLLMFFLGGVAAMALRLELLEPASNVTQQRVVMVQETNEQGGRLFENGVQPLVPVLDENAEPKLDGEGNPELAPKTDDDGDPVDAEGNEHEDPVMVEKLDENGQEVMENYTVRKGERFKGWKEGDAQLNSNNVYNRLFSLHGTIMVFLFIIPAVPAALGNIFLPIMLGA